MHDVSRVPQNLVLDLGTATTKAGWAERKNADLLVTSMVGRCKNKEAMRSLGLKDSYVGKDLQGLRGILNLSHPIRNGQIEHWEDVELLWQHIWSQEQQILQKRSVSDWDSGNSNVLVSLPPSCCSVTHWKKLAEVLFEGSDIEGLHPANKCLLSMYGSGRTTGVCVDSGEDMTYIVPCWEGVPLPDATVSMNIGGKHLTDRLLQLLSKGKYSFPDDTYILMRRSKPMAGMQPFFIATHREVVQEAKERFCTFNGNRNEGVLRLPDGNMVVVGEEASLAPEVLFQPDLMKGSSTATMGLHEMVLASIMKCEEKYRSRLLANIVLTGGNSLIPDLHVRLQAELSSLLPGNTNIRVLAQKGREHFTWTGGAHLCSLSSFQRLWITKYDYLESGPNIMNDLVTHSLQHLDDDDSQPQHRPPPPPPPPM